MINKYTLIICDYPILSETSKRLFKSLEFLPKERYELIYLATGRSHAEQLNMGLRTAKTRYVLFVDNDLEFEEKHSSLFNSLDEFWYNYKDAATVCLGHSQGIESVDESTSSCYNNFAFTCYDTDKGVYFDENFIATQCLDVAFFRNLRYLGWKTYTANFMSVAHHHKEGKHEDYVNKNQELMVKMFGCPTDTNPETCLNKWKPFEEYFMNRDNLVYLSEWKRYES